MRDISEGGCDANLLSERGRVASDWEDFLNKYSYLCDDDPYDKEKNPEGYVNLGNAVNDLCVDIIHPKLTSSEVWSCDSSLLQYRESYGIPRIREVFAKLMTEFFESHEPVSADDLFCVTGVTGCMDLMAHCLADPGDVFLVPSPMYGRIPTDCKQRALVDIWPIHIITEDNNEDCPTLTMEKVIKAYESAIAAKRKVRGILILNPSNPLGEIYSAQLLMDMMNFCKQHSLHFVSDEIYALSVFSKTEKFHSVLKFSSVPDPERTHVLYGLSKDFGIAGLRIGIVHTKCKPLKNCLRELSFLMNVPYPIMEITARFLEDLEWCKNYLQINQERLTETFDSCSSYLKKLGLKVYASTAAFFLWVDLRHLCRSFEEEQHFFEYMFEKCHLYIAPGKEFWCAQPGWFRIVFTVDPSILNEGLKRFENALKSYKPPQVLS